MSLKARGTLGTSHIMGLGFSVYCRIEGGSWRSPSGKICNMGIDLKTRRCNYRGFAGVGICYWFVRPSDRDGYACFCGSMILLHVLRVIITGRAL